MVSDRGVSSRGVHKKPKPKSRTENPKNRLKWAVTEPGNLGLNGSVTKPVKITIKRYGYGYDFL